MTRTPELDLSQLASGAYQRDVLVWGVVADSHRWIGRESSNWSRHVAWSPNGAQLASGGDDGTVYVWDAAGGVLLQRLAGHHSMITSVAWSPDGTRLASGSGSAEGGVLFVWDVQSGERVLAREAHQGTVQSLRRSPDGTKLASCGDDGAIIIWDMHNGDYLQTLRRDRPYERLNITGIRGLTEAQKATLRALGAVEDDPLG